MSGKSQRRQGTKVEERVSAGVSGAIESNMRDNAQSCPVGRYIQ